VEDTVSTVVDDRLGKTIYADNIKLINGKVQKRPIDSLNKAGLKLLSVDKSALYERLKDMGADNIITPIEKRSLEREWDNLTSSKNFTLQKVTEYGIGESDVVAAVLTAYDELENYLNIVLDPTQMSENTDITGMGNITTLFETYYTAKATLDETLFRLETGMLNGMDYRTKFNVSVLSSTGITVPLDGSPSTLRVVLYQEGVEVTDEYLETDFTWNRVSEDRVADGTWRGDNSIIGKSIVVNVDDLVYGAASFMCTFKHLYSDTMYFEKVGVASLSKEVPGKDGEDSVSVQIFSSNGNLFRDGQAYTTMSATVWKGDEDITSQLDASLFSWERTSGDAVADAAWNTSSKAIGKKIIEITPQDVVGRSVFACHVEI
jgi:hypothetical protein